MKKKSSGLLTRCAWVTSDPLYMAYHDNEWGRPIYDDQTLFEFLILEGAQAGLNWLTILKKREGYRTAFDHFDAEKIACYDQKKIEMLMQNPNIIRNRLKIQAAITNAQAYLAIKETHGDLQNYLWQFVNHTPIKNQWTDKSNVPTTSTISDVMSKTLKHDGFKFIGSTICYAFMQAVGMVNDHTIDCFCHNV